MADSPAHKLRNVVLRRAKRPMWRLAYSLTGRRLQLETHFLDFGMIGASFDAPVDRVREALPSPELVPVEHAPGRTFVQVMATENRRIDILRPYAEIAIAVPVTRSAVGATVPRREGLWLMQHPVTTEDARWPAVENYGFPSFVAEIRFERQGDMRVAHLLSKGQEVLSLAVQETPTASTAWRMRLLAVRDGTWIESTFEAEGQRGESTVHAGAVLALGDHPLAHQIRETGCNHLSSEHVWIPDARGVLSRAFEVGHVLPPAPIGAHAEGPIGPAAHPTPTHG